MLAIISLKRFALTFFCCTEINCSVIASHFLLSCMHLISDILCFVLLLATQQELTAQPRRNKQCIPAMISWLQSQTRIHIHFPVWLLVKTVNVVCGVMMLIEVSGVTSAPSCMSIAVHCYLLPVMWCVWAQSACHTTLVIWRAFNITEKMLEPCTSARHTCTGHFVLKMLAGVIRRHCFLLCPLFCNFHRSTHARHVVVCRPMNLPIRNSNRWTKAKQTRRHTKVVFNIKSHISFK